MENGDKIQQNVVNASISAATGQNRNGVSKISLTADTESSESSLSQALTADTESSCVDPWLSSLSSPSTPGSSMVGQPRPDATDDLLQPPTMDSANAVLAPTVPPCRCFHCRFGQTSHGLCAPCLPSAAWSDAIDCAVCGCILGKRHLRPRHHCRVCMASVCASCSPSRIKVKGKVECVCTSCVRQPLNNLWGSKASHEHLGHLTLRWLLWPSDAPTEYLLSWTEGWGWSEALDCHCCGGALGKRRFNPRHHCRICTESVCGTCSPSQIMCEGKKSLQRICRRCVGHLYQPRSSEQESLAINTKKTAKTFAFSERAQETTGMATRSLTTRSTR